MKKLNYKKPKINLRKRLPFLMFLAFLAIAVSVVGFVYFLFNRPPSHEVVDQVQEEVSKISISFNEDKTKQLLGPEVTVDPPAGKKSPFANF